MAEDATDRNAAPLPQRTGILVVMGLVLFHLCQLLAGNEAGLWLPGLGIGIALTAWVGLRIVILLAIDAILAGVIVRVQHPIPLVCLDGLLLAGQIGISWWVYRSLARGSRRLEDPHSATIFLLLVPGVFSAFFALVHAAFWQLGGVADQGMIMLAIAMWISRILGILTLTPFLLVVVTPLLVRRRMIAPDERSRLPGGVPPDDWTVGEAIETGGLCLGSLILTLVMVALHANQGVPSWAVWGLSLLLVVWSSLREGLRGGTMVSMAAGVAGLSLATRNGLNPSDFSPLQANILAQCSTALLVGASAGWIRANEARYRQVVGHIPVVLYSVRLPRGIASTLASRVAERSVKAESPSQLLLKEAEVTLVSTAARKVFDVEPDDLLGPYARWLERVLPEDRELLVAGLGQLCMQRQPVSCEYRLRLTIPLIPARNAELTHPAAGSAFRWVRDTLAPHYTSDGVLQGWEGVVEDISEQRALSQTLRHTTSMFQALVTHLPTGVFFVQGPFGQPLLVNARARQLLGQREDHAAGIVHLAKVYRLHRPDGSEYPVEELPVTKALRQGIASMANDIVVHRPDGRRVPLITWAAPVNLGVGPAPDAAVWVLEDLSSLQQAEVARKETEARLRAVIETMAEGVLVQNSSGQVIECNPAACIILGRSAEQLMQQSSLGPEAGCLREDGSTFPREEHPDRLVLSNGEPVRNVLMGIPHEIGAGVPPLVRWIYINAMPLPVGNALVPNTRGARVVTTFADITALRQAQEDVRRIHRLELVARIASGTLHDFNNLLTVMMGLAGMAQLALPEDHAVQSDLTKLQEVGEQAGHLAGQLLTFSKQKPKSPHPVDVNSVVVHSLKILKSAIPARIRMEKQIGAEANLILADEMQLKQVVMNLCINARDAIVETGTIRVIVARERDESKDGVCAPADPDIGWIRLTVEDTGSGMEELVLARIFEPFFSTKERGTGLGLAVVHQIVQDLGGRLEVASEPGVGTRIDVWLRQLSRV